MFVCLGYQNNTLKQSFRSNKLKHYQVDMTIDHRQIHKKNPRSLTVTGHWSWTGAGVVILLLVFHNNINNISIICIQICFFLFSLNFFLLFVFMSVGICFDLLIRFWCYQQHLPKRKVQKLYLYSYSPSHSYFPTCRISLAKLN